jgi:chitinase
MFNLPTLLALALPILSSATSAKALDERALPITATTTVVVEATVTETVYWIPEQSRLSSAIPTPSGTAFPPPLTLVAEPSQFVSSRSVTSSGYTRSGSSTPGATKPVTTSSAVKTSSASSVVKASSTSSPAPVATAVVADSGRPMVAAYYPDWVSWQLSPEQINWSKFDWVDFGKSRSVCEDASFWDEG